MVAKMVKTPNFPVKNGELGAFCVLWVILICLQLFLPIFPNRVGAVAAEDGGGVVSAIFLFIYHYYEPVAETLSAIFIVSRKPPAVPVVPKSFSYAQNKLSEHSEEQLIKSKDRNCIE